MCLARPPADLHLRGQNVHLCLYLASVFVISCTVGGATASCLATCITFVLAMLMFMSPSSLEPRASLVTRCVILSAQLETMATSSA